MAVPLDAAAVHLLHVLRAAHAEAAHPAVQPRAALALAAAAGLQGEKIIVDIKLTQVKTNCTGLLTGLDLDFMSLDVTVATRAGKWSIPNLFQPNPGIQLPE